jgi:hypothetical protein
MDRHPNILNAASNLLGICFVIITGLRITRMSAHTVGDEVAWVSALLFLGAIGMSYLTIRRGEGSHWHDRWAERAFLLGVAMLTLATLMTGLELA